MPDALILETADWQPPRLRPRQPQARRDRGSGTGTRAPACQRAFSKPSRHRAPHTGQLP